MKTATAMTGREKLGTSEFSGARVALGGDATAGRTFNMLAYPKGATFMRSYGKCAIELGGMETPGRLPMLVLHADERVAGVAESIQKTDEGLVLHGPLSSKTADGKYVTDLADELRFPWTGSVGVEVLAIDEVEEGEEALVDGVKHKGPLYVWRKTRLNETSFITAGPAVKTTRVAVMHEEVRVAKEAESVMALSLADYQAATKKRAEELRAAFPDDATFANECALEGLSVTEAQAKMLPRVLEKLKKITVAPPATEPRASVSAALESLAGGRGKVEEKVAAEAIESLSDEEVAKRDWHRNPIVRAAFRDSPVTLNGQRLTGVDCYAAWLRAERNLGLAKDSPAVYGAKPESSQLLIAKLADYVKSGSRDRASSLGLSVEQLSSWGRAGPDMAAMTVKGYLGMFYRALETSSEANWAPLVASLSPSNQETETYKFLGQYPMPREWLNNRRIETFPIYTQNVSNKRFEATVGLDEIDLRMDKWGQIGMRLADAGTRFSRHWEKLLSALIQTNPTAFDAQALFSASHTLGGSGATFSNLLTSATAGCASLAVTTPTAPDPAEFAQAIVDATSQFYLWQDDKGEPINDGAKNFVIMCPPTLYGRALEALKMERLTYGASNPTGVQDQTWTVIKNPRLTTSGDANALKKFYLFRTDTAMKALVMQEATGFEIEYLGAGSDETFRTGRVLFGAKVWRNVGPLDFACAASCLLG